MRRLLPLLALLALAACNGRHDAPPAAGTAVGRVDTLKIIDVKPGTGDAASPGRRVTVNYTGWLYDASAPDRHGARFDSSSDHGEPISFVLGQGRVIKGWDQGLVGMKVGGRRTLLIPADMAYGQRGAGGVIPPDASLVFDVELVGVGAP